MRSSSYMLSQGRRVAIAVVVLAGFLTIVGSGGPRYVVRPSQSEVVVTNQYFEAQIKPVCSNSCTSFILNIVNHSTKNIEIDWNKTLYISRGTTSGGFMFEGVVFSQRNALKPPDIVFANSSFTKKIWPNNLVEYKSGQYGGWRHSGMPSGENGIFLTVRIGSEEISEKLTLDLNAVEVK